MIKGYKHCAEEGGMLEGLYESLPSSQQFKKQTNKKDIVYGSIFNFNVNIFLI